MKPLISFIFILICGITTFAQIEAVPQRESNDAQPTPDSYSSVFDIKDFKKYYFLSDPLELILKVLKKEKTIERTYDSAEAQFFIQYRKTDSSIEMRVFYIKDKKVVVVWAENGEKGSEVDLAEAFLEVLHSNKKLIPPGIVPSPQPAPETGAGFKTDQPADNSSRENSASSDSKKLKGPFLKGTALSLPKPVYPVEARAERAQGTVEVEVTIDEQGKVTEAKANNGHQLLRAAAEEAALRAKFTPTTLGGQPVKVTAVIVYNFVP